MPEHVTVLEPIVGHKQVAGELFIVKVCFRKFGQVVALINDFISIIFFILICALIGVVRTMRSEKARKKGERAS